MITLHNIAYVHPDKDVLFSHINFTVQKHDKTSLIGNNGAGKSTLLKIIAGKIQPVQGVVATGSVPHYIPQQFGQYNSCTIAQALNIDDKLTALKQILAGDVTDNNMAVLDDDWTIQERSTEALAAWGLHEADLSQKMESLSGGQKTKVFLAGIAIHNPEIVLMDEPTNHLDTEARKMLYEYINTDKATIVVVSHDRALLNLLNITGKISKTGITIYGGNYDFYAAQKAIENNAFQQNLKSTEKALRKAKETERESMERQQKLDARGKKKQEKSGLPTISMNTFKNNAEKSTSRIKNVHAEKVSGIAKDLSDLRRNITDMDKMRINLDNSSLHKGKMLFEAHGINFSFNQQQLWKNNLNFKILTGDRIAIKGSNGSGKTTLIKLLLGEIEPQTGNLEKAVVNALYIDQDYSLINNNLTVYEQAQSFNTGALQEHDIRLRLNRFLFTASQLDKPCAALSGGERMRLALCLITISNQAPDLMVLDEPTNNLDIQNISILTNAIKEYAGTVIAVSHDACFLEQIGITNEIAL